MVKPIMRDVLFLGQKSIPATEEDLQVGRDLQDTLAANREACVGMAANMIGVKKRIIAFLDGSGRVSTYTVRLNSEIIKKIYVPKYMFAVGIVCSEFINFLISLVV